MSRVILFAALLLVAGCITLSFQFGGEQRRFDAEPNATLSAIKAPLVGERFIALQKAAPNEPAPEDEIQLLVRADDMGVARAINEACIKSYQDGIVRSVEVIVPGSWFLDAVALLKENPGLDVGVHLTLTSEWERVKWRPLTEAPSLVDADGYFYPMTRQRRDFPPDTGFVDANPSLVEVERELRAQIEMALHHLGRQVSHVSSHMGAARATPELQALTERLASEYGLELDAAGLGRTESFGSLTSTSAQREKALVDVLKKLQPGQWLIVEHPAFDTSEMRAFGHKGYENVAAHRAGVTQAFTSAEVKEIIARRGIRLISYQDVGRGKREQIR